MIRRSLPRLQRGVELSTRVMALITAAFSIGIICFAIAKESLAMTAHRVGPWAHVATTAFLLTISILAGSARPTMERLRVLDAASTIGGGIGLCLFTVGAGPVAGRELVVLLFMAHALMIRAAIVPSDGRRTFVLGLLALLPMLVRTWLESGDHTTIAIVGRIFFTSLWCGCTLFASTLVSTKIYGLERKVAEARRLGPYTLEKKIGEGGMGEVYKARHALLRRPTAVKLVRGGAVDPLTIARFAREVQLTSQLTSPSTVQVYDFGSSTDGTFYYAMEYIDGVSLWQLVKLDGAQHPGRVVALLAQVCASLAEAHALGLIHRDVKPDNVLVCQRGLVSDVVKVVDFGLASLVSSASHQDVRGPIVGTAQYMAPEAILHPEKVDARTDLYAVGALAYFLLTGTDVFNGANAAVLGQQLHSVPQSPSSRLGAELPPDLERIVLRCLAKSPDRRPQSALALRDELLQTVSARTWGDRNSQSWWDEHGASLGRRVERLAAVMDEGEQRSRATAPELVAF